MTPRGRVKFTIQVKYTQTSGSDSLSQRLACRSLVVEMAAAFMVAVPLDRPLSPHEELVVVDRRLLMPFVRPYAKGFSTKDPSPAMVRSFLTEYKSADTAGRIGMITNKATQHPKLLMAVMEQLNNEDKERRRVARALRRSQQGMSMAALIKQRARMTRLRTLRRAPVDVDVGAIAGDSDTDTADVDIGADAESDSDTDTE